MFDKLEIKDLIFIAAGILTSLGFTFNSIDNTSEKDDINSTLIHVIESNHELYLDCMEKLDHVHE